MVKKLIYLSLGIVFLAGCFRDQPSLHDQELSIRIFVKYEDQLLKDIPVTLNTNDYNLSAFKDTTNAEGMVVFQNIPFAEYSLHIQGKATIKSYLDSTSTDTIMVTASKILSPGNNESYQDTVYTIVSGTSPGIKINELYTCGPPNKIFYFYDQFFELYNSSEDTVYLDGMVFCRMGTWLESVTYIFQFPGEPLGGTQDYPVPPDSFVVIAQDAFNHKQEVFNGEKSIDLSNADFEFRNSLDYGDYDNPDVPNLENIEEGHTLDFMVGVTGDIILIADGSDLNYVDGIDAESVLDCVEYASSSTHEKDIEDIVDRGFAGVGLIKYSGQSLERISPGFDTNNSTVDFVIIDSPTPGYQHE
ncbi:MAG: DUF4876 domain-containing protein [Candidatus Marinimicrobia bacterium]|nr:DUF4876 domain-containing protein [Candidatus Neomarinimicrobiota bacterium]